MTTEIVFLLFVTIVIGSIAATGWLRRHALATALLDVPNARSSHTAPTPRGGGVSIVVWTIIALLVAAWLGWIDRSESLAVSIGGALVGLVGAIDDRRSVEAHWRLLVHFIAAVVAISLLGIGGVLVVPAAFYLVWLLNLTNFMDGIDGIAGVETITVCLGAAFLMGGQLWLGPLMLSAATIGFLAWNWPPAKIFMGDAGSGFLGFTMAVLSLRAGLVEPDFFWAWVVLLGVFIVDATVTLIVRGARGDKVFEAHRTHAYQHLAIKTGSHGVVALGVGLINVVWLVPVAAAIVFDWISAPIAVVVGYSPLLITALYFGAGQHGVSRG